MDDGEVLTDVLAEANGEEAAANDTALLVTDKAEETVREVDNFNVFWMVD
jgi:hypothetical protein